MADRKSDGSIVFSGVFFSVNTIAREPLHSAWCNFTQTCNSDKVSLRYFGGDRDWHSDPGQDFRIFHCCKIGQKTLSTRLQKKLRTDLPEMFAEG